MISSAVCSWKDNISIMVLCMVNSSFSNSAEMSIHIPAQSLEI